MYVTVMRVGIRSVEAAVSRLTSRLHCDVIRESRYRRHNSDTDTITIQLIFITHTSADMITIQLIFITHTSADTITIQPIFLNTRTDIITIQLIFTSVYVYAN